jgi:hypothetical protein
VVDHHFGQRLNALAARLHVWICDTPVNRQATEEIWRANPGFSGSAGVTIFQVEDEDWVRTCSFTYSVRSNFTMASSWCQA